MKTVHYSLEREIPVYGVTDILVAGGGCAGLAAAVCAARRGRSVLLVERGWCLGGTATSGMVGPFMTCSDPEGKEEVILGFFRELVDRLVSAGGATDPMSVPNCSSAMSWHEYGHRNVTPFRIETLKRVAEEMCLESGVRLLYGTTVMEVVKSHDGRRIEQVVCLAKEGLIAMETQCVIDCTGDADIAYLAGCPTVKGDAETGELQAGGLFFSVEGIDEAVLQRRKETQGWESMRFEKEIAEAAACGDYPIPRRRLGLYKSCDNTWKVNATRIQGVDGTRSDDLTRIVVEGRRQVEALCRFFRKYVAGCEHLRLLSSAEMPGVRETRRIVGEFVLEEDSIVRGERFPDAILVCSNSRDTHRGLIGKYIPSTTCYTLPYRILLPQGIDNLLVAGRSVSCDRNVLAAIRVMPPCFGLGEAAGNAAALAVESHCACGLISVSELQRRLRDERVRLDV